PGRASATLTGGCRGGAALGVVPLARSKARWIASRLRSEPDVGFWGACEPTGLGLLTGLGLIGTSCAGAGVAAGAGEGGVVVTLVSDMAFSSVYGLRDRTV